MRLLIAGVVLVMGWEPSCQSDSSPSASGSGYYDNYPKAYYMEFSGRILDDSTGDCIDSAEVCALWEGRKSCHLSDQDCENGYRFKLKSSRVPYVVRLKVTHADYEPDSLMDFVRVKNGEHVFDFRLTPK